MTTSGCSAMQREVHRFFKIILTDVGSHTKLQLPEKFLRISGKNLKDSVSLNVPSGSQWSVELRRHRGKVWLKNGWPEFAKFYLIRFGYLLVFDYKGDSEFQVLIFDPSSLEIDYPLARRDQPNLVKSNRKKKRVTGVHDSSSFDDVVMPCKKTKAKTANEVEKVRAIALGNALKSKNPNFIHVMKESHIVGGGWPNVYIPKTFKEAHEKWKSNDKIILHVGRRIWAVFCNMNSKCNQCRISRGWTIFARNNLLNAGDVCVFELINRPKRWFEVFIYRAAIETSCEENETLPDLRSKADKATVLKSIEAYKPKCSFKIKIKNCYLYGGSITVPLEFINKYVTNDSCSITLQLPDGRVWLVKCYIKMKCSKFSAGWKKFSEENNLAAGDVCGFELVNKRLFNVVVFRVES